MRAWASYLNTAALGSRLVVSGSPDGVVGPPVDAAARKPFGGRFRVGSRPTEIPIISRWPVPSVLVVSGALGFHVGAGAFADWQVAVETAQVVAGLVDYPAGNPFYVYHTKLWTILHQVLAVALAAGLSERTLSVLVSGLLGMVSFQALSLIAYAISRDVLHCGRCVRADLLQPRRGSRRDLSDLAGRHHAHLRHHRPVARSARRRLSRLRLVSDRLCFSSRSGPPFTLQSGRGSR